MESLNPKRLWDNEIELRNNISSVHIQIILWNYKKFQEILTPMPLTTSCINSNQVIHSFGGFFDVEFQNK